MKMLTLVNIFTLLNVYAGRTVLKHHKRYFSKDLHHDM